MTHQKALHGDALRLARRFWETGSPDDLKRFRTRYRDFGAQLLAGVNEERRTTLGLVLQKGQPVLLSEQSQGQTPTTASNAVGPPVKVNRRSGLRVYDYGDGFDSQNAQAGWRAASSPADRIGVIRATPSIIYGEVDRVTHGGEFIGASGAAFVGDYALGNLLGHLAAPAAPNSEAQLHATTYEGNVVFGLRPNPDTAGAFTVVRDERFAVVNESGATFDYGGSHPDRALPRRRTFTLAGATIFDLDPDLLGLIFDTQPGLAESVACNGAQASQLTGSTANAVGDYVRQQDAEALRPVATRFTVTQCVVPPFAEAFA